VVDTKSPSWGTPILEAITNLTPKPVTMIINTHAHADHVGGNVEFPANVKVVTHENAVASMVTMDIFKASGGRGLPTRSFADRMTIGSGQDRIDLYYFGRGHTSGDIFVVFRALCVAFAGDMFASWSLPIIDGAHGGSALEIGTSLQRAYDGIANVDRVITGHGAVLKWSDLEDYAQFNTDVAAWLLSARKAGLPAPALFKTLQGLMREIYEGETAR
jgi:cyclase